MFVLSRHRGEKTKLVMVLVAVGRHLTHFQVLNTLQIQNCMPVSPYFICQNSVTVRHDVLINFAMLSSIQWGANQEVGYYTPLHLSCCSREATTAENKIQVSVLTKHKNNLGGIFLHFEK